MHDARSHLLKGTGMKYAIIWHSRFWSAGSKIMCMVFMTLCHKIMLTWLLTVAY